MKVRCFQKDGCCVDKKKSGIIGYIYFKNLIFAHRYTETQISNYVRHFYVVKIETDKMIGHEQGILHVIVS